MTAGLLGEALALCSALSFALANNMILRTSRSGGDKGVMFSVLVTMALSALLWLVFELPRTGVPDPRHHALALASFVVAGVAAMVFGRSLVFESIRRLGVARSSAVKRLNPFFSVLLAALVLGETVTASGAIGIAAIAASFVLLVRESLRRPEAGSSAPPPPAYAFGVIAALCYAVAYVLRKLGLEAMPAPAFGTMVSAVSGFAVFAGLAVVSPTYRLNFSGMFRFLDRWVVLGALLISCGQIFLFAALAHEKVSTVVMIASVEIFISIFLSALVFRSEWPSRTTLLAAAVAMLGVVLVASG